jgi:hypothetical protein
VTAQLKFTVPLNDPAGVIDKPNVAVPPAVIVVELDPPDPIPNVKSAAAAPMPETTTTCDPVPALSATIKFAVAAPAAVGVKVTLIVQLASGCTVEQLFVWENSPALAPPKLTPDTLSAIAPEFVKVTGVAPLLLPTV